MSNEVFKFLKLFFARRVFSRRSPPRPGGGAMGVLEDTFDDIMEGFAEMYRVRAARVLGFREPPGF